MALQDEVVDEIISIFKEKVESSVNDTDMSNEDKDAFVDRYIQAFRESIQFSILKCFGEESANDKVAEELSDQGKTEADDVEKLNDALLTATGRRARYPNKAAKMLEKTLETNSEILKVLKTDAPITNCPVTFPKPSEELLAARQQSINKLSEDVDSCRRAFLENSEKVQNLKKSYQIVYNNLNT